MRHLSAGRVIAKMARHNADAMQIAGGFGDVFANSRRYLTLFNRDNKAYLAVE
jgi:hypothetical protein